VSEDLLEIVAGLDLVDEVKDAVRSWLVQERYASERAGLVELVRAAAAGDAGALAELDDAFSRTLPIGTGGRRGKVGPGPNRFNAVVVRETAQGVAEALKAAGDAPRAVIVYDTRRDSRRFSEIAAAQLAANDLAVTLIDAPRPTPELSFLVRSLGCGAGIVMSASHNPPEDNGIKIYGPDGAQVLGARDRALMGAILAAGAGPLPTARLEQLAGVRRIAGAAVASSADAPYLAYVAAQGVLSGSLADAGLVVAFTPLHGVGHWSVVPTLRARGITVHTVDAQCDPDEGRFSTVRSANPELPESMAMAVGLAQEVGADLVIATDPDADRIGACVRVGGAYEPIDGNRLGVIMLDHVLREQAGGHEGGWVLTTMVSSPLIGALARAHGVTVVDDLLVGFKHHAGMLEEQPGRPLIFGCEESHGYMRGNGVRDKDGAIAALLLSEAAVAAKRAGETLLGALARVWCAHGYHRERTANLVAPGLRGRQAIAAVMTAWRAAPPAAIGGLAVTQVDDRRAPRATGSPTRDLPGDVLSFELAAGERACRLVLRPSGTEPKLKVYAMARSVGQVAPAALLAVQEDVDALVDRVLADAEAMARRIMAPLL
jgi:phosphomannomutase